MHLLAVEIGGSKLQFYTGTEDGCVLDRQTVRVDRASGGEGIRRHIREVVTALQGRFQWRAAVAAALPNLVMDAFAPGPSVRLTGLGEDAVPVGALLLAGTLHP